MKCANCNKDYGRITMTLIDAKQIVSYCPNCLAMKILNGKIKLADNGTLTDEISGTQGAVRFESNSERYTLKAETMFRLISHNLTPNEYKAVTKIHSPNNYMLYDDFYTSDGIALQPMITSP